MAQYLKKVAIVGVTGRVGGAFATALLKGGKHTVTGLTRAGSKGTVPDGVHGVEVDYENEDTIVAALRGQDFLAITLSGYAPPGTHTKLVQAAVKAGVPLIMPNGYGYDPDTPGFREDIPMGEDLWRNVHEIAELGGASIAMACGFWYQWSLALGERWFGFDVKNRTVTFYDDGRTQITASTWDQCARAFAALLSLPVSGAKPALEDWKNGVLRVESFRVSQRDMLESLHRVLGTTDADWAIRYEPSQQRFQNALEELQQGDFLGSPKAFYARMFHPSGIGLLDQDSLANQALGLPKEDLDAATRDAVQMVESGWNPLAG